MAAYKMRKYLLFVVIGLVLSFAGFTSTSTAGPNDGFTKEDRERLIRLETTVSVGFKQIDKRFEQIDKRFEQVDKRFEFIQNLMIGMLGVFGGLCGVFVGLLLWDRKTFKEKAKEEAIKEIEEQKLKPLEDAIKEFAEVEPRLHDILKKFHIL
jgi:H+/Cl- antiporter ClcA